MTFDGLQWSEGRLGPMSDFRTLHAVVRGWRDVTAVYAGVEGPAPGQSPGSVSALASNEPQGDPVDAADEVFRIWIDRPARCRFEHDSPALPRPWVQVLTAERDWTHNPWFARPTSTDPPSDLVGRDIVDRAPLREMWDPRQLIAGLTLGRPANTMVQGRAAIRAVGSPRDPDAEEVPGLWLGADEHELVLDIERGVVLRLAARVDGAEFAYYEVESVTFDVPIPATRFAPLAPDS